MMSVNVSRRGVLLGVGAASVVGASGCAGGAPAVFNPATGSFLANVAAGIFAAATYDLSKSGLQNGFAWAKKEWSPKLPENICYYHDAYTCNVSDGTTARPALFVAVDGPQTDPKKCSVNGPLVAQIAIQVRGLKESVVLPGWAWQTLLLFQHDYMGSAKGENKAARAALLRLGLTPARPRIAKFKSALGVTESVAYQTHLGWVDLGRAKVKAGKYEGHIEVGGVPDADNRNYVGRYKLPTKARGA